jgi:hypothetical protein
VSHLHRLTAVLLMLSAMQSESLTVTVWCSTERGAASSVGHGTQETVRREQDPLQGEASQV